MKIDSSKNKAKAVFLDRDGTIIKHVHYLTNKKDVCLLPGTGEAVAKLNRLGYLVFIITNQSMVARGLMSVHDVVSINNLILSRLNSKGAKVHNVYFCPHHPDTHPGASEYAKQYSIVCDCRKPSPGMLIKAINEFNVYEAESFMVGDSLVDVVAGKLANLKTIKVKTGPGNENIAQKYSHIRPDFEVVNLKEAVKIISNNKYV